MSRPKLVQLCQVSLYVALALLFIPRLDSTCQCIITLTLLSLMGHKSWTCIHDLEHQSNSSRLHFPKSHAGTSLIQCECIMTGKPWYITAQITVGALLSIYARSDASARSSSM
ncbi:hypothetical protein BKA63DRAFT_253364 [Paraphoma chrysanthemicola]|nr:hypothetical protein BKA63DRAFT_253364 [Paraphoma chrysanthemicola]